MLYFDMCMKSQQQKTNYFWFLQHHLQTLTHNNVNLLEIDIALFHSRSVSVIELLVGLFFSEKIFTQCCSFQQLWPVLTLHMCWSELQLYPETLSITNLFAAMQGFGRVCIFFGKNIQAEKKKHSETHFVFLNMLWNLNASNIMNFVLFCEPFSLSFIMSVLARLICLNQ